jgi:predicted lipoprotein with Yx(FWY)xxD motif
MKRLMLTGALALGLFATGYGAVGASGATKTAQGAPALSAPVSGALVPTPPAPTAPTPPTAPTAPTAPAKTAKVQLGQTKYGKVLTDAKGRTLYLFEKDTKTESYCTGACAKAWPPYVTQGRPEAGAGVKASLLGTLKRTDGTTQVTYGGHPLYYFIKDTAPGNANGQDVKAFGADWYVVGPDGKKVK